jgi:RNA-binding protein YhbY
MMDDAQKVMEDLWLLSNNGKSMRDLMLLGRNALNGINQSVVEVINADVNAQKVLKVIFGRYVIQAYV